MLAGNRWPYLAALILTNILAGISFFGMVFFTNPGSAGAFGAVVLAASFILILICSAVLIWQLAILKKK